ncbi:MAG: DUF4097 family beta strand repeat protein [Phycisphaerae bacterium]|nr:DUF4097 family beta strand repeat protein [Phycisphaerae bacterium]
MITRASILVTSVALTFPLSVGCMMGASIWTDEVTEELRIDTAGLTRLEARTHNGAIQYTGHAEHEPAVLVQVTKKGGGRTMGEAQDALAAIEVFVEPRGADTQQLAWRWKTPKLPNWGASVSYKINAPASLSLDAQSHNGEIKASGVAADAKLVSHNGQIDVQSSGSRLDIETNNGRITVNHQGGRLAAVTHNGPIIAKFEGDDLALTTHNGRIEADLSRCKSLHGDICSHNGEITLTVGDGLSADLTCATHNGSIRCDVPWKVHKASRCKLVGRIGEGGPKLTAETHNGSIHIKGAGG